MGFKSVLKTVVKVGKVALPIAAMFGVPGASGVLSAVDIIQGDDKVDNNEAVRLTAASVDALDQRLQIAEAFIAGIKSK